MIREIYFELIKYSEKVKEDKESKARFTYLNPDTIVVDQFNLRPSVYFEPLLKEAMGLTFNPMSIESRIAFEPTPKGFDYFRAPQELADDWNVKIRDPTYGNL